MSASLSLDNRSSASLSLDLDNKWSYLKTHGDRGWDAFPSYLDVVVPRFLEVLAKRELRITVFVVGQDAALAKNRAALSSIAAAGHEIGNHSFHHEPWLHRYSPEEIEEEIASAEECIANATGVTPKEPDSERPQTPAPPLPGAPPMPPASTLPGV